MKFPVWLLVMFFCAPFHRDALAGPYESDVRNLVDKDPEVQLKATKRISDGGVDAVPDIIAVAGNTTNSALKTLCIDIIGTRRESSAIDALNHFAGSEPDWKIREHVVHALGRIRGEESTAALNRIASNDDTANVRVMAIIKLGHRKGPEVNQMLELLFANPNTLVRLAAGRELAKRGNSIVFNFSA